MGFADCVQLSAAIGVFQHLKLHEAYVRINRLPSAARFWLCFQRTSEGENGIGTQYARSSPLNWTWNRENKEVEPDPGPLCSGMPEYERERKQRGNSSTNRKFSVGLECDYKGFYFKKYSPMCSLIPLLRREASHYNRNSNLKCKHLYNKVTLSWLSH